MLRSSSTTSSYRKGVDSANNRSSNSLNWPTRLA